MRRISILALGLLLGACGDAQSGQVGVGAPAPDYAAATLAGDTIALSDLRGQPVLLNIWATWCEPCRDELPDLQSLADDFAGRGLRVVAVSIDQAGSRGDVRRFIADYGIRYTVLHDPASTVTRRFRTIGVPESFLLDERGVIRARWIGQLQATEVAAKLRGLSVALR